MYIEKKKKYYNKNVTSFVIIIYLTLKFYIYGIYI